MRGRRTIALLEGLEQLRPSILVGYLEDFVLRIEDEAVALHGYYVRGTGVRPKYFWIDDRGHVVIVSGLYTTWVLQSVAAGGRDASGEQGA